MAVLEVQAQPGDVYEFFTTEGTRSAIAGPGGGTPTPSVSHMVWVSSVYGSDTTGEGTLGRPYATITHALSTITTASAVAPWQVVVLPGTYADIIGLQPWIAIIGLDRQSVTLTGAIQLDAAFGDVTAWVSHLRYTGAPMTLDYVFSASPEGKVFFTDVFFQNEVTLVCNADNETEFDGCTFNGACTQLSGQMTWYRCAGATGLLRVAPTAGGLSGIARLNDSSWAGAVHADNNGIAAPGVIARIDAYNTSFAGQLTVTAVLPNQPVVNIQQGAVPNNPTLVTDADLPLNGTVTDTWTIPAGTAIAANAVTSIGHALPAGKLNVNIETLRNETSFVGATWTSITAVNCTVFAKYTDTPTGQVDVCIYNPGAAFNTAAELRCNYLGYRA